MRVTIYPCDMTLYGECPKAVQACCDCKPVYDVDEEEEDDD